MKNKLKVLIILVFVCVIFTACGSKSNKEIQKDVYTDDMSMYEGGSGKQDGSVSMAQSTDSDTVEESTSDDTATSDSNSVSKGESEIKVETNRKIIRNVSLDLETQDFDKVVDTIESEINALGGYAQSIDMNDLLSSTNRYCSIIARIPAAKLDSFVNKVDKTGNVVSKNMSAEDVTVNYVDMQSHVKVLKAEQKRLLELIEKAVDLDSIILLENQLTDIRYELESYESQLRMYDNLVDYSTVTISVQEVIRYTQLVEKDSTWQQMKSGLKDTLYDIKDNFTEFLVWIASNIPYIIFWGVVIIVGIVIIKKKTKKRHDIKNINSDN
jgi:hypothetical protein